MEPKPRFFAIHTLYHQRTFYAGYNVISGDVILDLVAPKKARNVCVHFIGLAETEWDETEYYTDSNGERQSRTVHLHETKELIHLKQIVWSPPGGGSDGMIPPGQHILPFNFDVSQYKNLPPTFSNGKANIMYMLKANVDRPWRYDHRTFLPITMLPVIDTNDPTYDQDLHREDSKTICCLCCADGPISVTVKSPACGWCPGEYIPVAVCLNNHASKPMKGVSLSIDYRTAMVCQRHHKTETKRIATNRTTEEIQPETVFDQIVYVQVPPTAPSFKCDLVEHSYKLHFVVHLPGASINIRLDMPITIGTIPHFYPPLFEDQKAALAGGARPTNEWANTDAIVSAAAQANSSATYNDGEYNDAYQGEEPTYSSLPTDTQYTYFQMPDPSAGTTAASTMPMSFGAPCQANDIPDDE